ncbi:hypothetical protein P280DRAFT_474951 [Massarina eburnea CBS 473.64]|uniref:Uncharacterized protein n=1 Tax=Massarina eburnea CBS 473.64 TaxID=1395130 RepID=A0A6A6RIU8_9PLEO|nr:hypothetical protein P280DRAFT_474951 [Massarina eburnea CBS 473.64]
MTRLGRSSVAARPTSCSARWLPRAEGTTWYGDSGFEGAGDSADRGGMFPAAMLPLLFVYTHIGNFLVSINDVVDAERRGRLLDQACGLVLER